MGGRGRGCMVLKNIEFSLSASGRALSTLVPVRMKRRRKLKVDQMCDNSKITNAEKMKKM